MIVGRGASSHSSDTPSWKSKSPRSPKSPTEQKKIQIRIEDLDSDEEESPYLPRKPHPKKLNLHILFFTFFYLVLKNLLCLLLSS